MKSFVYIIAAVSLAVIGTLAYCGAAGNTAAPVSSPAMAETAPAAQKPQTLTITEAPKERRIKVSGLTIIKKAFGDTETVNDTDLISPDFFNFKGTDSLGNKIESKEGLHLPAEHIADIRFYNTYPTVFSKVVRYLHYISAEPRIINVSIFDKVHGRDCFIAAYLADPKDFGRRYSHQSSKLGDGCVLTEYDVFEDANRCEAVSVAVDPESYRYLRALTHKGKAIWVSLGGRLLDVKKNGNKYVILTGSGVEYVTLDKGHIISDIYTKQFGAGIRPVYLNDAPGTSIESGQILTDNIVRIKYSNGAVAHFKAVLTWDDYQKDAPEKSEGGYVSGCPSLIWHNEAEWRSVSQDGTPAWDFNPDTSKEPEYK